MGKTEKENDWKVGVLSPRVQGVVSASKGMGATARRTTMGGVDHPVRGHVRESSVGVGERAAMRLSVATPLRGDGNGHVHRPSLATTGKSVWR